jgi:hypothetical protein
MSPSSEKRLPKILAPSSLLFLSACQVQASQQFGKHWRRSLVAWNRLSGHLTPSLVTALEPIWWKNTYKLARQRSKPSTQPQEQALQSMVKHLAVFALRLKLRRRERTTWSSSIRTTRSTASRGLLTIHKSILKAILLSKSFTLSPKFPPIRLPV